MFCTQITIQLVLRMQISVCLICVSLLSNIIVIYQFDVGYTVFLLTPKNCKNGTTYRCLFQNIQDRKQSVTAVKVSFINKSYINTNLVWKLGMG